MLNGKVSNRLLVVIVAILIHLSLGAMYAWSVFTAAYPFNFHTTQTLAIFTAGLFAFAPVIFFTEFRIKNILSRTLSRVNVRWRYQENHYARRFCFAGLMVNTGINE